MKLLSIAVSALIGLIMVSVDQTQAINVQEASKKGNKVRTKKNGKKVISVGLTQTEYKNNRYDEYI